MNNKNRKELALEVGLVQIKKGPIVILKIIYIHVLKRQAATKAYCPHNLRSVGIANKSEFNTAKMTPLFLYGVNFDLKCISLLW